MVSSINIPASRDRKWAEKCLKKKKKSNEYKTKSNCTVVVCMEYGKQMDRMLDGGENEKASHIAAYRFDSRI